MDVDERRNDEYARPEALASAFADVKRTGGAVLLVGDGPDWIGRNLRKQLFGDGFAEPRRRISISTTPSASAYVPPGGSANIDAEEWTVINYVTARRGATQSASPAASARGGLVVDQECSSLPELGVAISTAIERFEQRRGGLEPAELRLGFDSVIPLLEDDKASVFRFLHLLIRRIKSARGLAHVPLFRPYDSEIVRLFAPLFDVVVELRLHGGTAQQRWHFTRRNLTSDWLSLSS